MIYEIQKWNKPKIKEVIKSVGGKGLLVVMWRTGVGVTIIKISWNVASKHFTFYASQRADKTLDSRRDVSVFVGADE